MNFFYTTTHHSHPSVGRSPEYHIHPHPPLRCPIYCIYFAVRSVRPHTPPPPPRRCCRCRCRCRLSVGCWLSSSSVVYILFAHLCIFISHLPHYPDLTAWPCHRPLNPVLISLMSSLSLITHSFCLVFFFPFLFLFLVFLHFSFFLFLFFT